jgi:hypothetical protein
MTTYVFRRVATRAIAGLWRQKQALALGTATIAVIAGYMASSPALLATPVAAAPAAASGAVTATTGTACADTTMMAIAQKTPTALQQAYQCLDASAQQRMNEQQFAAQVQASGPTVTNIARIGIYHDPSGSSLVYYALSSTTQSIGYVVYLDANGLVADVQ